MEKIIIKGEFYNSIIVLIAGISFPILAVILGRIIADASFDVPGFILIGLGIILIIDFFVVKSCEIVVTDKRIYGKAVWGKRVDLPMDSVSAVGSDTILKGISVATSSGTIKFALVKNSNEIQNVISSLLINRQNKTASVITIKQEIPQSSADELKKYKDLLDSDIITQEEFDAKKKQLLGL